MRIKLEFIFGYLFIALWSWSVHAEELKPVASVKTPESRPSYEPPFATPYPIPQPVYRAIPKPGQKDEFALFDGSPWLVVTGDNEVTVVFLTKSPTRACVEWGQIGGEIKTLYPTERGLRHTGTLFRISLSGLEAGKSYRYTVSAEPILEQGPYHTEYGQAFKLPEQTFRWPYVARLRLAMFNDTHNRTDLPARLWPIVTKNESEVDFVLLNGDIFSEPLPDGSTFKEVLKAFAATFANRVPIVFTRGNHEPRGAGAGLIVDYLPPPNGEYYGGLSLGGVRLVLIDTGEDKPDNHWEYSGLTDFANYFRTQQTWLAKELQSQPFTSARWKVLACHIPPGDHEYAVPLAMDLLKAPFHCGLCAHMHIAEWRKPGVKTTWQHRDEEPGAGYPILIGGGPDWGKATISLIDFGENAIHARVWMENGDLVIDESVTR